MGTAPNDAPIKVRVSLHVHLYLGLALLVLSGAPFFALIFFNGGAEASPQVLAVALGAVALLHVALALTARCCSTDKLKFWDGIRLVTAYMTYGIGPFAMCLATAGAMAGLVGSIGIAAISPLRPQHNWAAYKFGRMIGFFYRHRMYQ